MAGSKILIVNDDPGIVNTLSTILKARSYKVSVASSGVDGLEKAKADRPDLVIVDVAISDMNGFEVCAKLKAERSTRSVPVIMISENGGSESVRRAHTAGASDYLVKPFDLFTLLNKLNKVLAN